HCAPLAGDHSRPARIACASHVAEFKVKRFLPRAQPPPGLGHQHRQLGLRARSTHVLDDVVAPVPPLGDLHLRRTRAASRLANEHHDLDLTDERGTSLSPPPPREMAEKSTSNADQASNGTSQVIAALLS